MTQEELDRLHAHHLSALLEVDRICRARGLKYFITGGTLLGAIRHKGFIPWDDDLDVGMLRCDYDRFVATAQQELGDRYFLQTNRTDPEYFLPFAKIRVNGTKHVIDGWQDVNVNHGAFIDIFPIDNVPKHKAARVFHDKLTYSLKMACIARSKFRVSSTGKKRAYRLMRALTKPFTLRFLVRRTERAIAMFRKNRSGLVVNITGAYGYSRETFPIAYLDEYVPVPFEGHDVMTMACWHDYLTKIYGDYMKPPPEHKRTTGHEPVELKL